MSIRLLLADDHEVVRTGMASLLADTDIEIVAQAGGGEEAVELVKQHCLTCHVLNGYGGNKAPGDLAALARTFEDDTFRALVLDPRSVQADSTMPPLSPDLPEQERNRIVNLLRAYLLQMPGDG